jgi:hypothetical protein
MSYTRLLDNIAYLILVAFLFLILLYANVNFVVPEMNGEVYYRLGADSLTYQQIAQNTSNSGGILNNSLIGVGINYLAPVTLIIFTNFNYTHIFVINFLCLTLCIFLTIRSFTFLNRWYFTLLIFLNPLMSLSLITVNKEIFGVLSICLALFSLKLTGKPLLFVAFFAIFVGFFARWQQGAVVLIFYASILLRRSGFFYKISKSNWKTISVILIASSIIFPFLASYFSVFYDQTQENVITQSGRLGGLLPLMNDLQNKFLYIIIAPAKILFNYFGNLTQITSLFLPSENEVDFYNSMQIFHQILMLIIVVMFFIRKQYQKNKEIILFIGIYSILYSLNYFIAYRYFFPLYFIFCALEASRRTFKKKAIATLQFVKN